MSQTLQTSAAVGLIILSAIAILTVREWRWAVAALAVQYIGVVILVSQQWPVGVAVTKMVVGWMSGAALGITMLGQTLPDEERSWPSSTVFRLLAAGMVLMIVFSVSPKLAAWLPGIPLRHAIGGLTLIGMGMIQLGMTARPFRVILGLLTFLSGFEILYAAVEYSVLVAGLLSGVNLGLALLGCYLISLSGSEEPV